MVCRKTLEQISWRVRYFFLESPVFLPGESGISSWRVRYFFLESPVFLPGESGVSSWRVRCFFLESPVFLPGESGIGSRNQLRLVGFVSGKPRACSGRPARRPAVLQVQSGDGRTHQRPHTHLRAGSLPRARRKRDEQMGWLGHLGAQPKADLPNASGTAGSMRPKEFEGGVRRVSQESSP
jgi:hypothetical protein